MITAIWCENSALVVGMPRRSTEWSTESSCTSVARWISSTTAASVTARGSSPPAAWWLSSSSVGRNSLPFIRSRWSFTAAMIEKSAAMMRRSSPATRSSCAATGCCTSRRVTGATCWLTSLGAGERLGALAHVQEADVDGERAPVQLACLGLLALCLERPAEPVEDRQPLLIARRRQLERPPQNRFRHDVRALLDEAQTERLRALQLALGRAQRLLELGDRLVEQPHFLEGDAEVVVRLEVGLVDVLVDPLLEARQHLLEIALLVPRRLLVGHLHLGVPGRHPAFGRLRPGRGRHRRQHAERGLRALVAGIVLRHPLVDRSGLVRQVAAQQRVRQLEVGVDQLRLVPRLERELHLLLAVPHAVGVEPQDLVHQVPCLGEVAKVLEPRRGEVQLFDPALPLAFLDQRLAQRLV